MAEAMLARALAAALCAPGELLVAEPIDSRRAQLAEQYGVAVTSDNAAAANSGALLVLAVKPQHIAHVYSDLRGALDPGQTVLSIAAGVPLRAIADGLAHERIIRAMPNTPAQIGAGVSVWTAAPQVPDDVRQDAAALLQTLGREWYVDSEDYIDMATAVSGSGPAYVFAFIEALTEGGVFIGMPRDMAQTLAVETALGAARLAQESGTSPALLREMVTSPGGTTAAALHAFERSRFKGAVMDAVAAALERARELGGGA